MLIPINDPMTMWEESTSIERKGQTTSSFLAASRGFLQALPCFHRRRAQDGSSSSITSSSSDGLCGRDSGLSSILIFFSGCSFAADDTCCTFFVW